MLLYLISRRSCSTQDVTNEKEVEDDTAWTQVLMAHLLNFNTWGSINSFSVFQEYYTTEFQQSSSSISWIGSLQIFLTLFLGTFAGIALDTGLYRTMLFVGPLLQLISIFLTSISTKYWHLLVLQGIVQGIGDGLIFGPTITNLSTYFNKKRSMAMAIAACGTATGGIVFPIIAQQLLPKIGFPWTIRVLGFVVLFNSSIAQVFSRERHVKKASGPLFDMKAFRDIRYSMFSAAIFMMFCSLYVAYFYVSFPARSLSEWLLINHPPDRHVCTRCRPCVHFHFANSPDHHERGRNSGSHCTCRRSRRLHGPDEDSSPICFLLVGYSLRVDIRHITHRPPSIRNPVRALRGRGPRSIPICTSQSFRGSEAEGREDGNDSLYCWPGKFGWTSNRWRLN